MAKTSIILCFLTISATVPARSEGFAILGQQNVSDDTVNHSNDHPRRHLIRDIMQRTLLKVRGGLHYKKIYPGTKWCGSGNISTSVDDVGLFSNTDKCCREHDMCPQYILAKQEKFGLKNADTYTKLNCDCDRKFYSCLKNTRGIIAKNIGFNYFTVLGSKCFQKDYPIETCVEERRGRCYTYVTNAEGEKKYQWFDNPIF